MTRLQIPIASGKVTGSHTDFPVYLKPSAITGWGSITLAQAQSIRCYSDAGFSTELAREVVSADEIHIKIPSLSGTPSIYVDYDGVRADYSASATYGARAVWSGGYGAVWHMGTMADSASGGHTMSDVGPSTTTTAGAIGTARVLNGSGNLLSVSGPDFATVYTMQVLHKPAASTGYRMMISGAGDRPYMGLKDGSFFAKMRDSDGWGPGVTLGEWVWQTLVVTGGNTGAWFKNGVAGSTWGDGYRASGSVRLIGGWNGGYYSDADVDEIRVSTVARSADWITTEYRNQSAVGTFWGTAVPLAPPTPPSGSALAFGTNF